ncbi:Uncharacterized protein TPAR_03530, partial [Tolypocladium paradoxum]
RPTKLKSRHGASSALLSIDFDPDSFISPQASSKIRRLPNMNLKSSADIASINILDAPHHRTFERALMRILETDLAEETYAEILDGMPTAATWRDFHRNYDTHPAHDHHELCSGAHDRAREFRAGFEATSLQFPLFTILAFQEAEPGSKEFNLRLLELLAVSCHQIAVYLCEINGTTSHHAQHIAWRDEPREIHWYDAYRPLVAFSHGAYNAVEQYSHGIADVAGYWAEAKIFGGVIVFDRGETEVECRDIYIHATRSNSPITIFPPTLEQFNRLMQFLLANDNVDGSNAPAEGTKAATCPLPIIATSENRWRWHPWDAFARFHIFRDRYERKVSEIRPPDPCQARGNDWPEMADGALLLVVDDEEESAKIRKRLGMVTPSSRKWGKRGNMQAFYELRRSEEPKDAWCYNP